MPFGGRDAELACLDRWLMDEKAAGRMLLTAPAGRGKSALLVRWIASLQARGLIASGDGGRGWRVVFVPISIRFGMNRPSIFYQVLATRLGDVLGEEVLPPPTDPDAYYADKAQAMLRRIASSATAHVLVVVDGLDEALGGRFDADIFPRATGTGLKILVSARLQAGDADSTGWRRRLGWDVGVRVKPIELGMLDARGVADVLVKMGAPLDRLATERPLVERLRELSEGDPLLLRFYAEDLWQRAEAATGIRPEDLDGLTPGFGAYFERWLSLQRQAWEEEGIVTDQRSVDGILAVLACACGPLQRDDLARLAREVHGAQSTPSTQRLLWPLRRFVMGDGSAGSGYVLSHPKIGQYLRDKHFDRESVRRTLQGFTEWGRATIEALNQGHLPPEQAPAYLLQFLHEHLRETSPSREPLLELVSDGWRRAWFALERGYQGFAHDVARALSRIGHLSTYTEQERSQALIDKIRCVLCLSSICSLGTNVPPDLLPLAVAVEALTIQQALHIADLKVAEHPDNRAQVLIALAPYLSERDRLELLDDIRTLSDEESRARALVQLADYLSAEHRNAVLDEARALAFRSLGPGPLVRLLLAVVPHCSDRVTVASQAEEAAGHIDDGYERATILGDIARYLPPERASAARRRAIHAARSVREAHRRAKVSVELAFRIPASDPNRSPLFIEAIHVADTVLAQPSGIGPHQDFYAELAVEARAAALAGLASIDTTKREDLYVAAVRTAYSATSEYWRVDALTDLLAHLPEP